MHTVTLLEQATVLARQAGYTIRQEWLGGGGGACQIKGRKFLFLDVNSGPVEQLDQVLEALRLDPRACNLSMPKELREAMGLRKSA
jgi:hypothetical protein